VYIRRDGERLKEAALDIAEESGTWVGAGWSPTADPAVAASELSIGEASLGIEPHEAAELYAELLGRSA
jgi:hypothetical protein